MSAVAVIGQDGLMDSSAGPRSCATDNQGCGRLFHAVLADSGLGAGGDETWWGGAAIGSEDTRLRRRWAGYRRFPKPRISARSSSDKPPQIPYGSRVRSAC